jgi:hypothetical protein
MNSSEAPSLQTTDTGSSASCTAASATTPPTTNTPPGHTAKTRKPLDDLRPWDVYTSCRFPIFMSSSRFEGHPVVIGDKEVRLMNPRPSYGTKARNIRSTRRIAAVRGCREHVRRVLRSRA